MYLLKMEKLRKLQNQLRRKIKKKTIHFGHCHFFKEDLRGFSKWCISCRAKRTKSRGPLTTSRQSCFGIQNPFWNDRVKTSSMYISVLINFEHKSFKYFLFGCIDFGD